MNWGREMLLFCGLFLFGVIGSSAIEIPNVQPIAAVALFGGFVFQRQALAWGCPAALILVTVIGPGGGPWPIQIAVAAGLLIGVAVGRSLRGSAMPARSTATAVWSLAGSSLISSIGFYLLSNGAWWQFSGMYHPSAEGLIQCFTAGLPFFRNTLAGDLSFSAILFGGLALWVSNPIKSATWIAFKAAPLRS